MKGIWKNKKNELEQKTKLESSHALERAGFLKNGKKERKNTQNNIKTVKIPLSIVILVLVMALFLVYFFVSKNNLNFFNSSNNYSSENIDEKAIDIGSKGYISSAEIIQTKTGTGPWDENDEPGNDSSEDNDIVRSFDQVIWTIESTMQMKNGSTENSLTGGILNIEARLPETCTYMKWDIDSMSWAEGTGKTSDNGRTFTAQYKMSDENITVPGKQTLTLVLKLEGAKNGLEIKPEFKVWLEGNEESEKVPVENVESIYVSSAPKYDIRVANYNQGVETNTSDGDARVYKYSLAFFLQGDSVSKGLKGVEYPQGDLTFDIDYDLQRTIIGQSNYEDITAGNIKLYNYKYNDTSTTVLGDSSNSISSFTQYFRYTFGTFPYSTGSDKRRTVYQNGSVKMIDNQNGKINVTISNYGFNGTFPDRNDTSSYATDDAYTFTKDKGFISVGLFYMQVNSNDETMKEDTQCYMNIEANNFKVNTVGEEVCTAETTTGNNTIRANHITYPAGDFSKEVMYLNNNRIYLGSPWGAGNGKSTIGANIYIRSRVNNNVNNAKKDWMWGLDELIKFDDEAMVPIF